LHYAGTSLLYVRTEENKTRGILAADAGIEDVIWSIQKGQTIQPDDALPQNINNMNVTMQTVYDPDVNKGIYVLYRGDLVEATVHSDYVLMASGNITWDAGANAYKYIIYVTKTVEAGQVKLEDVGALLPLGYSYKPNSAALFFENLSLEEPTNSTFSLAQMVDWTWEDEPEGLQITGTHTHTQTFYITGTGDLENYYAWAQANRNDVATVGEFTGKVYQITATASTGPNVVSSVSALVMKTTTTVRLLYWKIIQ
jgi:hypothetical protein